MLTLQERLGDVLTRWQQYEALIDECDSYIRSEVNPWLEQSHEDTAADSLDGTHLQQATAKVCVVSFSRGTFDESNCLSLSPAIFPSHPLTLSSFCHFHCLSISLSHTDARMHARTHTRTHAHTHTHKYIPTHSFISMQ